MGDSKLSMVGADVGEAGPGRAVQQTTVIAARTDWTRRGKGTLESGCDRKPCWPSYVHETLQLAVRRREGQLAAR